MRSFFPANPSMVIEALANVDAGCKGRIFYCTELQPCIGPYRAEVLWIVRRSFHCIVYDDLAYTNYGSRA